MDRGYSRGVTGGYGRAVPFRDDLPKWEQVAEAIAADIESGALPPRSRVPSEHELVSEYGISRGTAAKVLARLADRGLIVRRQGLGSFVADR
jgi:DNA-binding GntR family transcriptional regulator